MTTTHTHLEPLPLDPQIVCTLSSVATATLTTILLKNGLRNVWMRGTRPLKPGQPRVVGRAFTLRFVPAREDLATPASWGSPISTRAAIEAMPAGCVAVVDAMGVTDAGIFGDILCARMAKRKVAALVTDGVMRDVSGVLATGLPIWCQGAAAPASVNGLTFVNWQEPIACGGELTRMPLNAQAEGVYTIAVTPFRHRDGSVGIRLVDNKWVPACAGTTRTQGKGP